MDLLQYDSSDSDNQPSLPPPKKLKSFNSAPLVPSIPQKPIFYPTSTTKELALNVPYSDLSKPVQGPANPYAVERQGNRNMMTGFVEEHHMNDGMFKSLYRTFNTLGYTYDPDGNENNVVGDLEEAGRLKGVTVERLLKEKVERIKGGDVSSESFLGPWAPFKGEEDNIEPVRDPYVESVVKVYEKPTKSIDDEMPIMVTETSTFHGTETRDYLGRSFLHPPSDVGIDLRGSGKLIENFIPKQLIHTWTGHTKSVNCIKFFPNSAHLILSCSMDCKIKIWDCYHERQVKRTYLGHSKGVKDVAFNNSGTQFLSASYDKYIKLWDTETGECISRYTAKTIPMCLAVNPNPEHQNTFLVGCLDKKIYQFDKRSGEITQTYDQHAGAISSITFFDDNKRFVSTSDDKSMRCWEFNVPIVIKYVSEPDMHSMPAVTLSNNQKWLACQSMDNKIIIFSALDRLRMHRKKMFTGHLVAGYACKPGFSPDNRFLMSGDSEGTMWFWDWKTCKVFKKMENAHSGPIMGCLWHPRESSKVATCSNDGTIKYWD